MKKHLCILIILFLLAVSTTWPEQSDLLRHFDTPVSLATTPAVGDDGTIYCWSGMRDLIAVGTDNVEKWRVTLEDGTSIAPLNPHCSPSIGPDGTIYVISRDGNLYAVSQEGIVLWVLDGFQVTEYINMAIDESGRIFAPFSGGQLAAVTSQGTLQWLFQGVGDFKTVSVGSDGSIFAATTESRVYHVSPDGSELWAVNGYVPHMGSIPVTGDNKIYISNTDYLYLYNSSGVMERAEPLYDMGTGYGISIDDNGMISLGLNTNHLLAITTEGDYLWTSPVMSNTVLCHIAVDSDGTSYAMTYDSPSRLYAVDSTGQFLWVVDLQSSYTEAGMTLTDNGELIIAGSAGIEVYDTGHSGPGNCLWPMFGGDRRNTFSIQISSPTGLQSDYSTTEGKITLSWEDNTSREDCYEIERSSDAVNFEKIGETAGADITEYQFTETQAGHYYYRVRAKNGRSHSLYSNTVAVDVVFITAYIVPNDIIWGRCKLYVKANGISRPEQMYITIDDSGVLFALDDMVSEYQSGTAFNEHKFEDSVYTVDIWYDGNVYDSVHVSEGILYPGAQLRFEGLQFTSASEGGRVLLYEMKPGVEKPGSTVKSFSVRIDGDGALKMVNPLGQSGALLRYVDGQWTCVSYGKEELVFNQDGEYALVNDTAGNYIPRMTGNALKQNYPNPFNPETNIDFELEEGGEVTLEIFDSRGRKVVTLVNGDYTPGIHTVHWAGKDSRGRECASGVYYCILKVNGKNHIKKMVLLK